MASAAASDEQSAAVAEIGLVGLAVMGQNLALNIASKGFQIAVWNRSSSKVEDAVKRAKEEQVADKLSGYTKLNEFVSAIAKPRKIIMLIQAGPPVDAAIQQLTPLMCAGDLIIDGGNEWFENTERRSRELQTNGILYMGMGVSGGEEGARHGPSLMPGGSKDGFDSVNHILTKIAAQEVGPCVSYIGSGGAGNYVKMVHNGIEYGDMQIIAEAYSVLAKLGGLSNDKLHQLFHSWNSESSELKSYLIEITADIFAQKDDKGSNKHLIDLIDQTAGAKGTGKWTIQDASERCVPCPSIEAAVSMRSMSALNRKQAAEVYTTTDQTTSTTTNASTTDISVSVREALYCAKICCYAQGFMLLQTMSKQKEWNLNLGEISRTWKGGCIIRAVFLDRIKEAFDRNSELPSLLLDAHFADNMKKRIGSLRHIVVLATQAGIPLPAMSASLAYFDAYRSTNLPLNLVQAQRDYFGAHTYKRVDMGGTFHTEWQHHNNKTT
eukprot:GHVS01077565.1.p1 GENE.GHVS01077565.1~~GHVS01077565.1.p1  ORF type:complete len:541 (-),score=109.37 GHVS01077565.1:401-1882(-)